MNQKESKGSLLCCQCSVPLARGQVTISYLGSEFPVELPRCPVCGQVYITEDLALGKMLQVEKALEDK